MEDWSEPGIFEQIPELSWSLTMDGDFRLIDNVWISYKGDPDYSQLGLTWI